MEKSQCVAEDTRDTGSTDAALESSILSSTNNLEIGRRSVLHLFSKIERSSSMNNNPPPSDWPLNPVVSPFSTCEDLRSRRSSLSANSYRSDF